MDQVERIKVTNKLPIGYKRTVGGLFDLVDKIREVGIPHDAIVDWRNYNLAEFTWSAYQGLEPEEPNDLRGSAGDSS